MVADRHRLAAFITSTADELSKDTNIYDLELQSSGCLINVSKIQAATQIFRVDFAKINLN